MSDGRPTKRIKSEADEEAEISTITPPPKRPRETSPSHPQIPAGSSVPANFTDKKRPTRGTAKYAIPKEIQDLDQASGQYSLGLSNLVMVNTYALARDGKRVLQAQRQENDVCLEWILDFSVRNDLSQGNAPLPLFSSFKEDEKPSPTLNGSSLNPISIDESDDDEPLVEPEGDSDIAESPARPVTECEADEVNELMDDLSDHLASSVIDSPPRRAYTQHRKAPSPTSVLIDLRTHKTFPQRSRAKPQSTSSIAHDQNNLPSSSSSPVDSPMRNQEDIIQSRVKKPARRSSHRRIPSVSSSSPSPSPSPPPLDTRRKGKDVDRGTPDNMLGTRVGVPVVGTSRGRRLLAPLDTDVPLVTVAMSGDLQFVDRKRRLCVSQWSSPRPVRPTGGTSNVQDAFVLGMYGVIGYRDPPPDRPNTACEISLIELQPGQKPVRHDISAAIKPSLDPSKAASISILAPIAHKGSHIKFISGTIDGRLYTWKASVVGDTCRVKTKVFPWSLPSTVTALAVSPGSETVYGASYRRIGVVDLESGKGNVDIVSNDIFHVHALEEKVAILEVNHLEEQMQVFDLRVSNFNQAPALRFGYRFRREDGNSKREIRYVRGSASGSYFARGYKDGTLRLWDIRMAKKGRSFASELRATGAAESEIMHVIFSKPASTSLVGLSSRYITFFDRV